MTSTDFLAAYPQFVSVPVFLLNRFIALAVAALEKKRWREAWELGVLYYAAHLCAVWMGQNPDASDSGVSTGLVSSESVDGVSVSYDTSALSKDAEGMAAFSETPYGVQFITMAKLYGHGGFVVP